MMTRRDIGHYSTPVSIVSEKFLMTVLILEVDDVTLQIVPDRSSLQMH